MKKSKNNEEFDFEEAKRLFEKAYAKPMTPEEEQAELDKLPEYPDGDTHAIFYKRKGNPRSSR